MTVTAGSVFLYLDMPKGFMPTQDTGVIFVRTVTTSNVSFTAMTALQRTVSAAILEDPAVEGLNSYIGTDNGSVLSNGEMLVALKPPSVRQTDHPAGDRPAARQSGEGRRACAPSSRPFRTWYSACRAARRAISTR